MNTFYGLNNLKTLLLRNNNISSIDSNALDILKNVTISINNNPLQINVYYLNCDDVLLNYGDKNCSGEENSQRICNPSMNLVCERNICNCSSNFYYVKKCGIGFL